MENNTNQIRVSELAERHARFLQFLRPKVGDAATAEDILQAAYVKAIEHGSELREEESSVAWFYRILRNAVTDHYRKNAVRARTMEQMGREWNEAYEPELKDEACACIKEVIHDLKPEYRAAIETVDLADKSIEDFAQAEKTTPNNAYVRLHRARKAVAQKLTAVCGTCATHGCVDCTCRHKAK